MTLGDGTFGSLRSPIARDTIGEGFSSFEGRMNGRVLPFVGHHALLVSSFVLIDQQAALGGVLTISPRLTLWFLCLLIAILLLSGAAHQLWRRSHPTPGVISVVVCLAAIVALLSLSEVPAVGVVIGLFLGLVALYRQDLVSDFEVNSAIIYLPFLLFAIRELSDTPRLVASVCVYVPLIVLLFY